MDEFFDALREGLHGIGGSAGVGRIFGANEQGDFSFGGALFEGREKFREFTAPKFFVELGDFAGDARGAVAENFAGVGDAFRNTMRPFVKNDGAILDAQAFESAAAFAGASRKKTNEKKFLVGQAAGGERGEKRGWSGDGDDRNMMTQTERDETMSRIGDQRHAGVADERDLCALFEGDEQFGRAREFVVLVIADERFADFVVVEKLLGVARVLAGDLVDFLEDAQGPQGDVFEIANGRANEVQAAQGAFGVGRSCCSHAWKSSMRCGDILSRMLYFFVWSSSGGSSCATVRVQVHEVRAPYGQDRKGQRPAPEEVSALRRQGRVRDHRAGDKIQRVGMVRDGLRWEIAGRREQRE